MKKSIIYIFAASILLLFASCNDFLDKTPRDTFTNSPKFWSNSNDVQSYSNKFYDDYIGFNHGGSFGWFYFKSLSDDQANASFDNWTYITVPATFQATGAAISRKSAEPTIPFKAWRHPLFPHRTNCTIQLLTD
jgi:hypothetical protein